MGMAASQARFLALTARKSNVEYQGQQINQQRTQLANQSSNLYTQMMDLTVPTPPSSSDFYTTTYTLDGSQEYEATGDYRITNAYKTYNAANEYKVTLAYDKETRQAKHDNYTLSHNQTEYKENGGTGENKGLYTMYLNSITGSGNVTTKLYYDEGAHTAVNESGTLNVAKNYIYEVDSETGATGFDEWYSSLDNSEKFDEDGNQLQCYFYRDNQGIDHFITNAAFSKLTDTTLDTTEPIIIGSTYTYTKEYTTDVLATMETSSAGRYSAINVYSDDSYSTTLSGATFSITATQTKDDEAYNDAYNDYLYNYQVYQQRLSEINAQTEVLQNKDQQLELRLQQLDTEQNAISTEMDSVTKVIEDNVEKTFKVFA